MLTAVLFFKQHSFSLWFRKFPDLISVWKLFSLTVILSEGHKAFLQIKQSLMVGRLHEVHVSKRSKIDWFFEKIRLFCLIALDKIWKTIIRHDLRHTHSTEGRWKKRTIFRQAPRRQVQRAPLSATSYHRVKIGIGIGHWECDTWWWEPEVFSSVLLHYKHRKVIRKINKQI